MPSNKIDQVELLRNLHTGTFILQKGIMVLFLVFSFLLSNIITTFNTCCAENNDYNPYCSGDNDKIQELTEEFLQKYGEEVKISRNDDTGIPVRIRHAYYDEPEVNMDDPAGIAFSFLSENSLFLGIDINEIGFDDIKDLSELYQVHFRQFYKGVPVEESRRVMINVSKSVNGRVELFYKSDCLEYLTCIDLDVVPTIIAEEAAEVVRQDLGISRLVNVQWDLPNLTYPSYDPYNPYGPPTYGPATAYSYNGGNLFSPVTYPYKKGTEVTPVVPNLIVLPDARDGNVYLCWRFAFSIAEPYGPFGSHYYFIDAHTGEIIAHTRGEISITASNDTSSNSTTSSSGSASSSVTTSSSSTVPNPYTIIYSPASIYSPTSNPYNYNHGSIYAPYNPDNNYNPYDPVYANNSSYTAYSFPTAENNSGWSTGSSLNLTLNYSSNSFQLTLPPSIGSVGNYSNSLGAGNYNIFNRVANYFSLPLSSVSNSYYGFPYTF
ncbi:MAG: hypothetical protein AB1847_15950 [bacterium]